MILNYSASYHFCYYRKEHRKAAHHRKYSKSHYKCTINVKYLWSIVVLAEGRCSAWKESALIGVYLLLMLSVIGGSVICSFHLCIPRSSWCFAGSPGSLPPWRCAEGSRLLCLSACWYWSCLPHHEEGPDLRSNQAALPRYQSQMSLITIATTVQPGDHGGRYEAVIMCYMWDREASWF